MKKKIINFNNYRDVIVECEPQSRTIKYRSKNNNLDIINLELSYLQFIQTEFGTRVRGSDRRRLDIAFRVYCSKESLFNKFDATRVGTVELCALDLPNITTNGDICQKKEEFGTTIEENILNFWSSEFNSDIISNIYRSYSYEYNNVFLTETTTQIDRDVVEFLKKTNCKNKPLEAYNKVRINYSIAEQEIPDPFIQEYFDLTLEERKEKYIAFSEGGVTAVLPKYMHKSYF